MPTDAISRWVMPRLALKSYWGKPTVRNFRGAMETSGMAGLERGLQARQGDLEAETLDAAKRHIGEHVDGERAAA